MNSKLSKIEQKFQYSKKRDFNLITPCCKRNNKDGKFVNFVDQPNTYGYCHSCGKSVFPPSLYKNSNNELYTWNNNIERFEKLNSIEQLNNQSINLYYKESLRKSSTKKKYIETKIVEQTLNSQIENNLLKYMRANYPKTKVDEAKRRYFIGTYSDGGTCFWEINKENNVQKLKVSYYNLNGKRTDKYKVPYKNEDGYYSSLFGGHLISKNKPIILVESEKTAIISSILLPKYTWLAYSGVNGLTNDKCLPLVGHSIIILPDMSENAVQIMKKKIVILEQMKISVKVWDMTNGKTDKQLKKDGWYNCDIEDVFRDFKNGN